MCGIYGFNFEDKTLADRMDKALLHRGPDGNGSYSDSGITLGHRRLAIIDLSEKGKQPMTDSEGEIMIIFNGEIYNYLDIKKQLNEYKFNSKTDTEVIIYAYKKWGISCLEKLNGIFAFAIYDKRKNMLILVRDRMGIKPLYYFLDNEKLIFASEIKAILEHPIKRNLNNVMIGRYVTRRYCYGNDTIWEKIYKIPPGSYMLFDLKTKKHEIHKYWEINFEIKHHSEDYFEKRIIKELTDSVKRELVSDVPLGVFLSGGLDSSTVTALMRKIDPSQEIKTYSVGFEHGGKFNELYYAKKVSEEFETTHKEFMIGPDILKELEKITYQMDEPMADPALFPLHAISHNASKEITVALTGDGGDELFAGYDQYIFLKYGNYVKNLPMAPMRIGAKIGLKYPSITNKFYKYGSKMGEKGFEKFFNMLKDMRKNKYKAYLSTVGVFNDSERKRLLKKFVSNEEEIKEYKKRDFDNKLDTVNQMLLHDQRVLLPDSFLMKTDKIGMLSSMELRVPFLEYPIINLANSIPSGMKLKGTETKYILKKALLKHKILPKDIIFRKKQGFYVPLDEWIQKGVKKDFKNVLDKKFINEQGIFDYKEIERIFEKFEKAPLYYGNQIWSLVCFEKWIKQYD